MQNLKVRAQRRSHITIHGSMSHFILAAVVSVVHLQSIQLGSKLGGNPNDALGALSGLLANGQRRSSTRSQCPYRHFFKESMTFPKEVERASSLLKQ